MGSKESSVVTVFQRQLVLYSIRTRSRKLDANTGEGGNEAAF